MSRESRHVIVTGIPESFTDDRITAFFATYGRVQKVERLGTGGVVVSFTEVRFAQKVQAERPKLDGYQLRISFYDQSKNVMNPSSASNAMDTQQKGQSCSSASAETHRRSAEVHSPCSSSSRHKERFVHHRMASSSQRSSREHRASSRVNSRSRRSRKRRHGSRRYAQRTYETSCSSDLTGDDSSDVEALSSNHQGELTIGKHLLSSSAQRRVFDLTDVPTTSSNYVPDFGVGYQSAEVGFETNGHGIQGVYISNLSSSRSEASLKDSLAQSFRKYGKIRSISFDREKNVNNSDQKRALIVFQRLNDVAKMVADSHSIFGLRPKIRLASPARVVEVCNSLATSSAQATNSPLANSICSADLLQPADIKSLLKEASQESTFASHAVFEQKASRTLYVSGIDRRMSEEDIYLRFSQFGEIIDTESKNRDGSSALAFVQYTNTQSVARAIAYQNSAVSHNSKSKGHLKLNWGRSPSYSKIWISCIPANITHEHLAEKMNSAFSDKFVNLHLDSCHHEALVSYCDSEVARNVISLIKQKKLRLWNDVAKHDPNPIVDYSSAKFDEFFLNRIRDMRGGKATAVYIPNSVPNLMDSSVASESILLPPPNPPVHIKEKARSEYRKKLSITEDSSSTRKNSCDRNVHSNVSKSSRYSSIRRCRESRQKKGKRDGISSSNSSSSLSSRSSPASTVSLSNSVSNEKRKSESRNVYVTTNNERDERFSDPLTEKHDLPADLVQLLPPPAPSAEILNPASANEEESHVEGTEQFSNLHEEESSLTEISCAGSEGMMSDTQFPAFIASPNIDVPKTSINKISVNAAKSATNCRVITNNQIEAIADTLVNVIQHHSKPSTAVKHNASSNVNVKVKHTGNRPSLSNTHPIAALQTKPRDSRITSAKRPRWPWGPDPSKNIVDIPLCSKLKVRDPRLNVRISSASLFEILLLPNFTSTLQSDDNRSGLMESKSQTDHHLPSEKYRSKSCSNSSVNGNQPSDAEDSDFAHNSVAVDNASSSESSMSDEMMSPEFSHSHGRHFLKVPDVDIFGEQEALNDPNVPLRERIFALRAKFDHAGENIKKTRMTSQIDVDKKSLASQRPTKFAEEIEKLKAKKSSIPISKTSNETLQECIPSSLIDARGKSRNDLWPTKTEPAKVRQSPLHTSYSPNVLCSELENTTENTVLVSTVCVQSKRHTRPHSPVLPKQPPLASVSSPQLTYMSANINLSPQSESSATPAITSVAPMNSLQIPSVVDASNGSLSSHVSKVVPPSCSEALSSLKYSKSSGAKYQSPSTSPSPSNFIVGAAAGTTSIVQSEPSTMNGSVIVETVHSNLFGQSNSLSSTSVKACYISVAAQSNQSKPSKTVQLPMHIDSIVSPSAVFCSTTSEASSDTVNVHKWTSVGSSPDDGVRKKHLSSCSESISNRASLSASGFKSQHDRNKLRNAGAKTLNDLFRQQAQDVRNKQLNHKVNLSKTNITTQCPSNIGVEKKSMNHITCDLVSQKEICDKNQSKMLKEDICYKILTSDLSDEIPHDASTCNTQADSFKNIKKKSMNDKKLNLIASRLDVMKKLGDQDKRVEIVVCETSSINHIPTVKTSEKSMKIGRKRLEMRERKMDESEQKRNEIRKAKLEVESRKENRSERSETRITRNDNSKFGYKNEKLDERMRKSCITGTGTSKSDALKCEQKAKYVQEDQSKEKSTRRKRKRAIYSSADDSNEDLYIGKKTLRNMERTNFGEDIYEVGYSMYDRLKQRSSKKCDQSVKGSGQGSTCGTNTKKFAKRACLESSSDDESSSDTKTSRKGSTASSTVKSGQQNSVSSSVSMKVKNVTKSALEGPNVKVHPADVKDRRSKTKRKTALKQNEQLKCLKIANDEEDFSCDGKSLPTVEKVLPQSQILIEGRKETVIAETGIDKEKKRVNDITSEELFGVNTDDEISSTESKPELSLINKAEVVSVHREARTTVVPLEPDICVNRKKSTKNQKRDQAKENSKKITSLAGAVGNTLDAASGKDNDDEVTRSCVLLPKQAAYLLKTKVEAASIANDDIDLDVRDSIEAGSPDWKTLKVEEGAFTVEKSPKRRSVRNNKEQVREVEKIEMGKTESSELSEPDSEAADKKKISAFDRNEFMSSGCLLEDASKWGADSTVSTTDDEEHLHVAAYKESKKEKANTNEDHCRGIKTETEDAVQSISHFHDPGSHHSGDDDSGMYMSVNYANGDASRRSSIEEGSSNKVPIGDRQLSDQEFVEDEDGKTKDDKEVERSTSNSGAHTDEIMDDVVAGGYMEIDADQLMLINSKKAREQADRIAAAAAASVQQQDLLQAVTLLPVSSLQTPPTVQPASVPVGSIVYPMQMSQPSSCLTNSPYQYPAPAHQEIYGKESMASLSVGKNGSECAQNLQTSQGIQSNQGEAGNITPQQIQMLPQQQDAYPSIFSAEQLINSVPAVHYQQVLHQQQLQLQPQQRNSGLSLAYSNEYYGSAKSGEQRRCESQPIDSIHSSTSFTQIQTGEQEQIIPLGCHERSEVPQLDSLKAYQGISVDHPVNNIQSNNTTSCHSVSINQPPQLGGYRHIQQSSDKPQQSTAANVEVFPQSPFAISLPSTSDPQFLHNAQMQQQYIQMCQTSLFNHSGVVTQNRDDTTQAMRDYAQVFQGAYDTSHTFVTPQSALAVDSSAIQSGLPAAQSRQQQKQLQQQHQRNSAQKFLMFPSQQQLSSFYGSNLPFTGGTIMHQQGHQNTHNVLATSQRPQFEHSQHFHFDPRNPQSAQQHLQQSQTQLPTQQSQLMSQSSRTAAKVVHKQFQHTSALQIQHDDAHHLEPVEQNHSLHASSSVQSNAYTAHDMAQSLHSSHAAIPVSHQSNMNVAHMPLSRVPFVWEGIIALKASEALVQLYKLKGNVEMLSISLAQLATFNNGKQVIRINQRMRMEAGQLESVQAKMLDEESYIALLCLPCGINLESIKTQTEIMKERFVDYLESKQAAGICSVGNEKNPSPDTIIHIFPPCDFASSFLERSSCAVVDLVKQQGMENFLFVVITSAG